MATQRIRSMASRLGTGLAFVAGLVLPVVATAADRQDPAAIQAHAEQFLKKQTAGLPGKVTIEVAAPRATLPACSAFDAFQPSGSRSMGKTTIGVRCLAPSRWTVYLAAQIQVMGSYVVTRDPLPANHVLNAADLTLREGDLGSLPADVITNADNLKGYRTVSGLAAGAPLPRARARRWPTPAGATGSG